jgi:hypothetical protein
MKLSPLKFLLFLSFVFWASGLATYEHEQLEHHGRNAACDDDDDDCTLVALLHHTPPTDHHSDCPCHHDGGCAVCQMLAGLSVAKSSLPTPDFTLLRTIEMIPVADWQSPILVVPVLLSARGPPVSI